eukprot:2096704-Heterocapsa_arctica.AAC.1
MLRGGREAGRGIERKEGCIGGSKHVLCLCAWIVWLTYYRVLREPSYKPEGITKRTLFNCGKQLINVLQGFAGSCVLMDWEPNID